MTSEGLTISEKDKCHINFWVEVSLVHNVHFYKVTSAFIIILQTLPETFGYNTQIKAEKTHTLLQQQRRLSWLCHRKQTFPPSPEDSICKHESKHKESKIRVILCYFLDYLMIGGTCWFTVDPA